MICNSCFIDKDSSKFSIPYSIVCDECREGEWKPHQCQKCRSINSFSKDNICSVCKSGPDMKTFILDI